ncbi:MAG: hypothetical protein HKM93_04340 [Desulfobacteraceae bacterium]|nr:hypothetical protein [Desulfobacteraceae bacterium]
MTSLQLASLISFSIAAAGFIITKFWVLPIYTYTTTKKRFMLALRRIDAMLDNSGSVSPKDPELRKLLTSSRKHCMDLVAAYHHEIPVWYKLKLQSRSESPEKASQSLMSLTNFQRIDHARNRLDEIFKTL